MREESARLFPSLRVVEDSDDAVAVLVEPLDPRDAKGRNLKVRELEAWLVDWLAQSSAQLLPGGRVVPR